METLLIVDDTKENLNILMELLGEEYDVIPVTSGKEALEILEEEDIDLVLLDVMMPEMDGFEVCKKIKENPKIKDIPIIFITAKTDENSIEKAYEIGGSDYVTKPFRPRELKARVRRELKLLKLQRELKRLSITDGLTNLFNRRYFSQISSHLFEIAIRNKKDLSILMIDIDRFKKINDTYGHQRGDEVLIKTAEILQNNSRKSDIVCRYGGEEFILVLPETSTEGAKIVAEKLRKEIEKTPVYTSNNHKINFTVSIGISSLNIEKDKTIEDTIRRADEALYEAKRTGRNKVCIKT